MSLYLLAEALRVLALLLLGLSGVGLFMGILAVADDHAEHFFGWMWVASRAGTASLLAGVVRYLLV